MTLCRPCIPRPSARALLLRPVPASATPNSSSMNRAETIMFAALFNPKVRVPADQVTVTVSKRQVHKPIGGTAGRKKRRLREERACNDKAITSKVQYLKASEEPSPPATPVEWVVPEAKSASPSGDDDFEVHTSVASDGRPD